MSVFHVPLLPLSRRYEYATRDNFLHVVHINSLIHSVHSIVPLPSRSLCHIKAKICSFSKNFVNRFKIHGYHTKLLQRDGCAVPKIPFQQKMSLAHRANIAISLLRRYRCFVERGGGDNLKEFIIAGVNAYALGCTDEGLRKELTDMRDSGVETEAMQAYGGSTSLKYKIIYQEFDGHPQIWCLIRCCSNGRVSVRSYRMHSTEGNGLTFQLEQMAAMGNAEEPSVVASRMRLVFSTFEVVSPQWPRV